MATLETQGGGQAGWQVVVNRCCLPTPVARAGQVLAPHPPTGRTKGQGYMRTWGPWHCPLQGAAPLMPPSIRLLPAAQGDLVVPYVLAVPAETKPVVSIPCELRLAWFGRCKPPKATSWWRGVSKALTASPRSPFSPCKRQREGVRGWYSCA